MLRFFAYEPSMQVEWDKLAFAKGTIFHTTAFRDVLLRAYGYTCGYHAVVDEAGGIHALVPLVIGRSLSLKKAGVSLPFVNYMDVCADSEEALQFAVAAAAGLKDKLKLAYVQLRLKGQQVSDPQWHECLQNFTFVLPLAEDEEQVLALSSSSNRNHTRKVYKNAWFDVSFDHSHLEAFHRVYVKRMKQLGSPAEPLHFFRQFFECLPDNSTLLTVLDIETQAVIGGMLLLTSPSNETLYYPYGGTLTQYNNKYLNNFMYWEAVRFGILSGMKYLDLGRSPKGSSHYKSKEKWGAKPQQLTYLVYSGGAAEQGPLDKESLSFFIELWKKAPSFITDKVGGVLIKYILP